MVCSSMEIKLCRSQYFEGFWTLRPNFKSFPTPFETTRANRGVVLYVSHL